MWTWIWKGGDNDLSVDTFCDNTKNREKGVMMQTVTFNEYLWWFRL